MKTKELFSYKKTSKSVVKRQIVNTIKIYFLCKYRKKQRDASLKIVGNSFSISMNRRYDKKKVYQLLDTTFFLS